MFCDVNHVINDVNDVLVLIPVANLMSADVNLDTYGRDRSFIKWPSVRQYEGLSTQYEGMST